MANYGVLTIDNVDMDTVLKRYELPTREAYNLQADADFKAALATEIDEGWYEFPTTAAQVQELGPMGKPDPQQQKWGKKQRDVRKFGNAWAYTYEWLARTRSLKSLTDIQMRCFRADKDLVNAMVLNPLFASTTYWGLVNGSYAPTEGLTAPPTYGQNTFVNAHTHYLTTGTTALTTTTPITEAKRHLAEHGHPGPYTAFCNSETIKDIEDMAGWYPRANGPMYNTILDRIAMNGFAGRMLGVDWVETEWVPANYIVMVSSPDAKELVGFVQLTAEQAHGLVLFRDNIPLTRETLGNPGIGAYPLINSFYLRWCNTYVLLRTAAVVIQVTEGNFADPDIPSVVIDTDHGG